MRILYACESGSRAWGFPSKDSDYDVRFIYVRPVDWYLSIFDKRDVIEYPISDMLDINGWDLKKALNLFRKSNPPRRAITGTTCAEKRHIQKLIDSRVHGVMIVPAILGKADYTPFYKLEEAGTLGKPDYDTWLTFLIYPLAPVPLTDWCSVNTAKYFTCLVRGVTVCSSKELKYKLSPSPISYSVLPTLYLMRPERT